MKIAISSIVGLVTISTVIFAQSFYKEKGKISDTIEYIKRETIGGKLDFTWVLKEPGFLPINHNGVRFNRNDYHVFLQVKTWVLSQVTRVPNCGRKSMAKS